MNKKYDIDTIISAEEFKKNRERHLERDAQKRKEKMKKDFLTGLGIALFYLLIVIGVILINARLDYLDHQKSADVVATQTAQSK